jgi:hypothetical protein
VVIFCHFALGPGASQGLCSSFCAAFGTPARATSATGAFSQSIGALSVPGADPALQHVIEDNLEDASWPSFVPDVVALGATASTVVTSVTAAKRFCRAEGLP